ncbi:hypothetical protein [Dyadobacter diqingensis]|uniref:hypothetical protein n=1 Tax=Dyadobacter diqingensis TaxID=2938121 RepID=UPI0020C1AAC2|nr:hypothetical protein [Dyadobacter diqingensis]
MTKHKFPKTLFSAIVVGCMFLGSTSLFAQVKIGTNPTTINAANNLEVEATAAGRITSVDKTTGQVTIKDGTEGMGKLLSSDANGGASWKNASTLNIPITAFTGYNTTDVLITTATTGPVPIPFAVTNPSSDWSAATNEYTIPSAGVYRLEFNALVDNLNSSPGKTYWNQFVAIIAGPKIASYQLNGGSYTWGPNMFVTSYFSGGEKVRVQVASYNPATALIVDNLIFKGANITVTKVN